MRFKELAEEIGLRVQKIRCDMDKSVPEFAAHCHIDLTLMYDIEKGKHNMLDFNLLKISHYTNTPIETILGGLGHLIDDKYDCKKVK